jgi:hypothetical protein
MKKTRLLEIIREEITSVLNEASTTYAGKTAIDDLKKDSKFSTLSSDGKMDAEEKLKSGGTVTIGEDSLYEMAKISGKLESAIKNVISTNSDLEGLPLKKKIRADKDVEDALEGDTLYDNQLNKFIALVKGEREVGQRGRKADPNKSKPETKKSEPKSKSEPKKSSTKDMDDEDKEAMKAAGKDTTAKALASTPEEKKTKFNQFLASVKKNKEDKAKIDGILKLAKVKFKFPKSMMDDLKRAAGRDVEV